MITQQKNLFDIALERLDGVSKLSPHQGRRRVRALCPAHGDTEHSLVVTEFSEDKLGVKCYTGCEYHEIMDVLGLSKGSIAPAPIKTHTKTKPHKGKEGNVGSHAKKQKPLGLYEFAADKGLGPSTLEANDIEQSKDSGIDCVKIPYKLMNGEFDGTYRLRFGKKDNGKAGQKWSAGKKHMPYGLWKLKNFKEKGYLFLVEGETDSLTLWLYNLPAIGIPGADNAGCLKAEHLEGIHTIYVVDEKDQGGKTFIKGITNQLQAIGWNGNLSSVTMPDGCKDPSDLHLKLDSYDKFLNQMERIRNEAKPIEATQPKKDVVELVKELGAAATKAAEERIAKAEIETGKKEVAGTVTSIEEKRAGQDDIFTKLEYTARGNVKASANNFALIFHEDLNLAGLLAYNVFSNRLEIQRSVPWSRISEKMEMDDTDESGLHLYIEQKYGIHSERIVNKMIRQVSAENKYNPLTDFLSSLQWDGIPRVDTLLIDYMGADDTELNRMQTRLTFVGAVARAFEAGCKFDYILTLKGQQGLGKSSFWELLSTNEDWFTDSIGDITSESAKEQIQGKWIIELGEMAAVGKGDQKRIKQFVTSRADRHRTPYDKYPKDQPRKCIFVATTNDAQPLKDDTGGRRWWIVDVTEQWFVQEKKLGRPLKKEVFQIWAEAVHVYKTMKKNKQGIMLPEHLENEARLIQRDNTDQGVLAPKIEYLLNHSRTYTGNGELRPVPNEICAKFVWVELLQRWESDYTPVIGREINGILASLDGWTIKDPKNPSKRFQYQDYGKQYVYVRDENKA